MTKPSPWALGATGTGIMPSTGDPDSGSGDLAGAAGSLHHPGGTHRDESLYEMPRAR